MACATRFQEKAITSVGITAEAFYSKAPAPDDYWRGIILFGSNVASYKFALAQSLLELAPQSGTLLKMSDLAPVYAKHIALHLQSCDKQGTSAGSTFLDACRRFNAGALDANGLAETTVRMGFKNVVDAFHVVGGRPSTSAFSSTNASQTMVCESPTRFLRCRQASGVGICKSKWSRASASWRPLGT